MSPHPYLKPFAIVAALLSLFLSLSGIVATVPEALGGRIDFRQLYTAGYMLRTGHARQLHEFAAAEKFQNEVVGPAEGSLPFNHLAYEAFLYAPFSLLPYRAAYTAFFIVNLAILLFAFLTLRPYVDPLLEIWTFLPAAIFLCYLPVTLALTEGQDSILLLVLTGCATRALDRGDDFNSGVLVALTLFKFQYALPIAFLFLLWRRWRFLAGFTLTATVVLTISIALVGPAGFLAYLHSIAEMGSRFNPGFAARYGIRPDLMPNLRGLIQALGGGSTPTTKILTAIASVAVLLRSATRRPSLPLAVLAAILVSYHHLITDSTMLILPSSLALAAGTISTRPRVLVTLATTVLLAPAALLLFGVRFYLLSLPLLALLFVWDGNSWALRSTLHNS